MEVRRLGRLPLRQGLDGLAWPVWMRCRCLCTVGDVTEAGGRDRSDPLRRGRRSKGFWQSRENQREFLDALAAKLKVGSPAEWRKVRVGDVRAHGGKGMLQQHESLLAALAANYPEHTWEESCRPQRQRGHWSVRENRRQFLDGVAKELRVSKPSEWRDGVTRAQISAMGGRALLDRFPSMYAMLEDAYPELEWAKVDWRPAAGGSGAKRVPRGHWDDVENRRAFMEELAEKFGVEEAADWKRVTMEDIAAAGGAGLLSRYPTVLSALNDVYGQQWLPSDCRPAAPKRYWESTENICRFLNEMKVVYRLQQPEDWARLSRDQILAAGGRTLLDHMSLVQALAKADPKGKWEETFERIAAGGGIGNKKKSAQRWMWAQVRELFGYKDESQPQYFTPPLP